MSDRFHALLTETLAYLFVFGVIFYLVYRYAPW